MNHQVNMTLVFKGFFKREFKHQKTPVFGSAIKRIRRQHEFFIFQQKLDFFEK